MVDHIESQGLKDREILDLFDEIVRDWWTGSFSKYSDLFTPPQRLAIPLIQEEKNVLICSPTGSGKTLSAFISIINKLFILSTEEGLENSVYCLYISPLKSLANDIQKNLERPLSEIQSLAREKGLVTQEILHAIRHGDVAARDKAKMLKKTPHILNTTPESLGILLNSPRFREKLRTVRWVIIDEIHSLAGSKRGVHLSLSLERLEQLKAEFDPQADPDEGSFARIGCSATIEPLEDIAKFLAGNGRKVEIVDTRFSRQFDLKLLCPVPDLIFTTSRELSDRLYQIIHEHIQEHNNTLVFTNTRNGAERVLFNLRMRYPEFYNQDNSGCHHGSMGKEGRLETENRLKSGTLKVVASSTSLELGIDMPHIDLVLQIGSPKSVAALLQRIGRAGHNLDQVVKGRIIVLDRDELMECAVMLEKGRSGFVDNIHIPTNCLDALCQHIFGMALERPWDLDQVKDLVKRSYCYRDLMDDDFMSVVNYLSGKYAGLTERHIYSKIWYEEASNTIGKRGRNGRMIYFMNTGMIPDQFSCDVLTRDGRWVGNLDEKYMEKLNKGDVFVIGGKSFRFCYRRGGNIYSDATTEKPNIPVWISEKLPLSFGLGVNTLRFKSDMIWKMKTSTKKEIIRWLTRAYPIDENSARSIYEIFEHQIGYLGEDSVPTDWRMVIEEEQDLESGKRLFYFLTNYGVKFNDGFSRMIAYMISRENSSNVLVSITDSGFMISVPKDKDVDITKILSDINEDNCEEILEKAVENTHLLKSLFRVNACRSFMILRNYMGKRKSARRQQVSADMLIYYAKKLDHFAVLKESYREIIEDKFEVENIKEILQAIHSGEIEVVQKMADSPSPMAFGIASIMASDVVFAQDKLALLKEFHKRVMDKIGYSAGVERAPEAGGLDMFAPAGEISGSAKPSIVKPASGQEMPEDDQDELMEEGDIV
ncbi:MAG TPA: ATP-dependent helicase [Methanotrichaceae archaeon]|nr:ATP-dependent helicase [Methanotrichaceae archaeon]